MICFKSLKTILLQWIHECMLVKQGAVCRSDWDWWTWHHYGIPGPHGAPSWPSENGAQQKESDHHHIFQPVPYQCCTIWGVDRIYGSGWWFLATPLKNMSTFPIYGKIKHGNQTTNQILDISWTKMKRIPMTFDGKNHFDPPAPGESPSFLQTSPSALEISWFEGTSTRNSRNHRFFSRKHGVIEKQSLKPIHGQLDEMTSFSRVPQHDPPTRLLPASLSGVELPTTSPRPRWWYNLAKWVSWGGTSWSQSLVGDLGGTWKPEILTLEKGQIIGQFKPIDFNRTGSAMPSNIAQWSGWFHHMSTYLAQFNQFFKYVQCSFMEYAAVVKHFSTRAKSSKEQISPGTSQALRAG